MIVMAVLAVFLWVVAAAFAISDLLVLRALFHFRDDREILVICSVVLVVFAAVCGGMVLAALAVGRNLAW